MPLDRERRRIARRANGMSAGELKQLGLGQAEIEYTHYWDNDSALWIPRGVFVLPTRKKDRPQPANKDPLGILGELETKES